jgi:hypothetical protein
LEEGKERAELWHLSPHREGRPGRVR